MTKSICDICGKPAAKIIAIKISNPFKGGLSEMTKATITIYPSFNNGRGKTVSPDFCRTHLRRLVKSLMESVNGKLTTENKYGLTTQPGPNRTDRF